MQNDVPFHVSRKLRVSVCVRCFSLNVLVRKAAIQLPSNPQRSFNEFYVNKTREVIGIHSNASH